MAANNSDSIDKLVVMGSLSYFSDTDHDNEQGIRDHVLNDNIANRHYWKFYGKEYYSKLWNQMIDEFKKYTDICNNDLPLIRQPCLVLHGNRDFVWSDEHPDYLVDNIPNARLVRFPKAGHSIHWMCYNEFRDVVQHFLLN